MIPMGGPISFALEMMAYAFERSPCRRCFGFHTLYDPDFQDRDKPLVLAWTTAEEGNKGAWEDILR